MSVEIEVEARQQRHMGRGMCGHLATHFVAPSVGVRNRFMTRCLQHSVLSNEAWHSIKRVCTAERDGPIAAGVDTGVSGGAGSHQVLVRRRAECVRKWN